MFDAQVRRFDAQVRRFDAQGRRFGTYPYSFDLLHQRFKPKTCVFLQKEAKIIKKALSLLFSLDHFNNRNFDVEIINTMTNHKIIIEGSQNMEFIKAKDVQLIVTSPPYPMIEMWDEMFIKQNPEIGNVLKDGKGNEAFELMHQELDKVWAEVERVLMPGGFACINIGDATRTINSDFSLYPNHARIISGFSKLGISNLPNIIWRKQTNAPNKFMGSGMLPAGAYVTLEHEWILIFRKGGKRILKTELEKSARQESAFFWEERNTWFSDLWDVKGAKQKIDSSETRKRSAAYPFEIPYRLINMYSLKGDSVLDPFLGTGTTTLAAIASERNSIGYEVDPLFLNMIVENIETASLESLNNIIENRVLQHSLFVSARAADIKKDEIKHFNQSFNLPVMTSQEVNMKLGFVSNLIKTAEAEFEAQYSEMKPKSYPIKRKEGGIDKQYQFAFEA